MFTLDPAKLDLMEAQGAEYRSQIANLKAEILNAALRATVEVERVHNHILAGKLEKAGVEH